MERDIIILRKNGKNFGLCLPDNYDEKTIDNMLSQVKSRILEQK